MLPVLKVSKKILLLLAVPLVLCLLVIVVGVMQFFQPDSESTSQVQPTASVTPADEKNFPDVTPQAFAGDPQKGTGTLVVTADMPEVFVYIDQPPETHAEAPLISVPRKKNVPPQYTPFRAENIPVGEHEIVGVKSGYMAERINIVIQANEVTRYNFSLEEIR